ncbi:MAG: hypothetical protein KDD02_10505 [Phaeodactylibacter sp.]|nr:hypothetical protein [Phaeodactylibacter sp.]MCB9300327.1 hypothetical protein [Lewinellaceae bacterium]HQU59594.1 hypothetical protein [Saprospiraceae bacterium]
MVKIPDSAPKASHTPSTWLGRQRWHIVRILQLAFGAFCLGDFLFFSHEWTVLAFGAVMLFQGIFDWQLGCVNGRCRI